MKSNPTRIRNTTTRLSAWLLLVIFLSTPVIASFHHHQGSPNGCPERSKSAKIFAFHIKCSICDYTYHQDAQKLISPVETKAVAVNIISVAARFPEITRYFSIHLRFPSANSPPIC